MSWQQIPLGDICTFVGGGTPKKSVSEYWTPELPWASVKDFKSTSLSETKDRISWAGLKNSASNLIKAGTVIVPTRMALGKAAINTIDVAINQDLRALNLTDQIDSRYMLHAYTFFGHEIEKHGSGATVKGITQDKLRQIPIPLPMKNGKPDLGEQRRIAGILDQADALRRKRRQALQLTDDFLRATFLDLFGDPVTNPKGWEIGTIGDLLESAKYGTSSKAGATGQFPILRMGNITYQGDWDFKNLKYIDLDDKDQTKYLVHKGELLFNRTNSKELVGKTAVYYEEEPMAFAGYLVKAIVNDDATPEYISAFMNSAYGKATLRGMCKNIVGMANINAKEFQRIKIAKPPKTLQEEFSDIVAQVSANKVKTAKQIRIQDDLFASLQQRAFKGEL